MTTPTLPPAANKFHVGNGADGKHYWLTPPNLLAELQRGRKKGRRRGRGKPSPTGRHIAEFLLDGAR